MLSTLTSYRLYSNDISKSLARIQADSAVKREEAYYQQNIGKVKTVDQFLDDQRLYTYALKAYGLADQAASKGFIRKVIESDLSDSASFANKLNDSRYRAFASAFNFKSDSVTLVAQSTGQRESLLEAYSERAARGSIAAAAKTTQFQAGLARVTSIDDLIDDPVLFEVAIRSTGLDPSTVSKEYVRSAFKAVAAAAHPTATDDIADLAMKFNFQADGTVPSGQTVLSDAALNQMIYKYYKETGNDAGPVYAAHETAYYESKIATMHSVDDLTNDTRLFAYAMTAFGLDPLSETPAVIHNILASDPSDATSALGKLPTSTSDERIRKDRLTALRAAFNFTANGSVPSGGVAQTAAALKTVEDGFYAGYQAKAKFSDSVAVTYYKSMIGSAKTISDLTARDPAFGRDALEVALEAFDIDPKTVSLTQIRLALASDASDPNSYVNKLGDERFKNLAAAFNFGSDGKLRTERLVQSVSAQTATGQLYAATFGTKTTEAQKTAITADTKAYLKGLADIDTLDDLLKSDKTLTYALKAYGLDKENLDEAKLRKILTSDLGNPKSYVYTLNDKRYVTFAGAFNFLPSGAVRLETTGVQTEAKRLSTQNLYLLQTLEEKVGEQSEGTRLALYFLRKAPDTKTTLGILADKALLEVTKTALGLPDSLSQLDVDAQVKVIEKKLKVADFQDKTKLDRFVARFAALYDMKNNSGANSPFMALFSEADSTTSLLARL